MKRFELTKGLDVPITGEPQHKIGTCTGVTEVALTGDDYIGMKPTMEVSEGDRVKTGQLLFRDKRNEGVLFTAPATGKIAAINRGAKRKFETMVIEVEEDDFILFLGPSSKKPEDFDPVEIRKVLIESGLWTAFRTRPYGKTPAVGSVPSALFITAMDTRPLAADPAFIMSQEPDEFNTGLTILSRMLECSKYLCVKDPTSLLDGVPADYQVATFTGPHPAGLPSTHIHFLHPAMETKIVWHIDYQDVIGLGHLFTTGHLKTEKIIAMAGPGVKEPQLYRVRPGTDIGKLVHNRLIDSPVRVISGSVIDGREVKEFHHFLGRYHNQVSTLHEKSGRAPFSWASLGSNRHSVKGAFISAMDRARKFGMNTATWGGSRAMFPIDSYHRVMPLDMEPLTLLKSIASMNTEKASALGALELIEEDVALLSYVCPGKNDFGPMLRDLLTEIEAGG